MAVTSIPHNSRLSLIFQTGTDPESGAPIRTTKSYSNIKYDATDQDVYDIAQALVSLQKLPFIGYGFSKYQRGSSIFVFAVLSY